MYLSLWGSMTRVYLAFLSTSRDYIITYCIILSHGYIYQMLLVCVILLEEGRTCIFSFSISRSLFLILPRGHPHKRLSWFLGYATSVCVWGKEIAILVVQHEREGGRYMSLRPAVLQFTSFLFFLLLSARNSVTRCLFA